jgi:hypothetical protein
MRSGRGSTGQSVRSLATQRISPALPDETSTAKGVGTLDLPQLPLPRIGWPKVRCADELRLITLRSANEEIPLD